MEYEVHAGTEMLYLNPEKQVYAIKDTKQDDEYLYCKDFAEAIGKFISKLIA